MAGTTDSPDFGPAENEHAFVYAVDYQGNWAWGYYFYNKAWALGKVSGCVQDSNNDLLIFGISNGSPYIMKGDPSQQMKAK